MNLLLVLVSISVLLSLVSSRNRDCLEMCLLIDPEIRLHEAKQVVFIAFSFIMTSFSTVIATIWSL